MKNSIFRLLSIHICMRVGSSSARFHLTRNECKLCYIELATIDIIGRVLSHDIKTNLNTIPFFFLLASSFCRIVIVLISLCIFKIRFLRALALDLVMSFQALESL